MLVLGAGYDTAFFQLAAEGVRADKYVEIDFLQVCGSDGWVGLYGRAGMDGQAYDG